MLCHIHELSCTGTGYALLHTGQQQVIAVSDFLQLCLRKHISRVLLADMAGDWERKGKAEGDGVKNVYKEFQSLVPALNDTTAPGLMEYLAAG